MPADTPTRVKNVQQATECDAFCYTAGAAEFWFEHISDTLVVLLESHSPKEQFDLTKLWVYPLVRRHSYSVLGVSLSGVEWDENETAYDALCGLRAYGFFEKFKRVVFVGWEKAAGAAIHYGSLVDGAVVLACKPRLWTPRKKLLHGRTLPLDGSEADADAALDDTTPEIWAVYDPFCETDAKEMPKLAGLGVKHEMRCGHFGIRANRFRNLLSNIGALETLLVGAASGALDVRKFWQKMRGRRDQVRWRNNLQLLASARAHKNRIKRLKAALPKKLPTDTPEPATLTDTVEHIEGGRVFPQREYDRPHSFGVLRPDGSYVENSRGWIRGTKCTIPPTLAEDEPIKKLDGHYLYAGQVRGHFGHFLVETTARLWAVDGLKDKLKGLIFVPYLTDARIAHKVMAKKEGFLNTMGIDLPIIIEDQVIEAEHLHVPELGFGWQGRYGGSDGFRQFIRQRFGPDIKPEGPKDIYVSRAGMAHRSGGIIAEAVLEANLERAGYTVFHPQLHPLEIQIAQYKAARRVLSLDGSALHLTGFFSEPGTQIGIILRRSKLNLDDYVAQFTKFADINPVLIDCVQRDWVASNRRARIDYSTMGEVDFALLFEKLRESGFVPADFKEVAPTQAEFDQAIEELNEKRNAKMTPFQDAHRTPIGAVSAANLTKG